MQFDFSLFAPWFLLKQRPHHFVSAVNAMGKRVQIFTLKSIRSIPQKVPPSNMIHSRLTFGPSLVCPLPFLASFNRFAKERSFREFANSQATIHILSGYPMWLPSQLNVSCFIYDCVDDWAAMPGTHRNINSLEHEICEAAHQIWVVSRSLQDKLTEFSPKVRYVPNGVNLEHFEKAAKARQNRSHHPPRLIYVGHIGPWFDTELVGQVARLLPEWEILLVGIPGFTDQQRDHLQRSNIKLPGFIPYDSLPSLFAECDVGMIPFLINRLTRGVSPIKLFEYLAAGLPVVASPMPEVLQFAEVGVVACADSPESFAEAVNHSFEYSNPTRCQQIAKKNCWHDIFQNALLGLPGFGRTRGPHQLR